MSHQDLEDVPTEILWRICSYLESPDRLSLHSLSMANKRIRSALLPVLLRKTKITMRGEEDLKRSLATLPQEFTKHIRQLVIQGWIPENQDEVEEITATYNSIPREPNTVENRFMQPNLPLWKALGQRIYSQPRQVTASENDAWKPLADFIANVPVLTDLIFNSACQLPPCLLQSLHSRVVSCKLHMNLFRLRSLEPGPSPVLHAREMDIIKSPCLYSVTTNYQEYISPPNSSSYYTDVLVDIVSKYAPHLKELYIFHERFIDPHRPQYIAHGRLPKPPWQGLRANQTHESNTRLLHVGRSLSSVCYTDYTDRMILNAINIPELRNMYCTKAVAFETLQGFANELRFDSLRRLRLTLRHRTYKRIPDQATEAQYESAASAFLSRLPALTELMCIGDIRQSKVDLILNSVGSQLKVLCIEQTWIRYQQDDPPPGSSGEVCSKIAESCPNMSDGSVKLFHDEIPTRFAVENGVMRIYVR